MSWSSVSDFQSQLLLAKVVLTEKRVTAPLNQGLKPAFSLLKWPELVGTFHFQTRPKCILLTIPIHVAYISTRCPFSHHWISVNPMDLCSCHWEEVREGRIVQAGCLKSPWRCHWEKLHWPLFTYEIWPCPIAMLNNKRVWDGICIIILFVIRNPIWNALNHH